MLSDTTPPGSKCLSQTSNAHPEDSSTDESNTEGTNGAMTSVLDHNSTSKQHLPINSRFHLNVENFDDVSVSQLSFPSIHFGRLTLLEEADSTSSGEDGDDFASLFALSHGKLKSHSQQSMVVITSGKKKGNFAVPMSPAVLRTLYIQMICVVRL